MDRPFVHINCAATADGKIARSDGSRLRISSEWDVERVHRLRARYGAIMVGAGTIIADDPKLTVKDSYVPDPPPLVKVVLDGAGRISAGSRFLGTPGRSIILTTDRSDPDWRNGIVSGNPDRDVKLLTIGGYDGTIPIDRVMSELCLAGIESIFVEGGSMIIGSILESGLYDLFSIYIGPIIIGGSGPTISNGSGLLKDPRRMKMISTAAAPEGGILLEYEPSG